MSGKNVLLFINVFSLFLIISYALANFIILPPFNTIEQKALSDNLDRCQNTLHSEARELLRLTKDWAEWDDSYEFIENHNQAYIENNLPLDYLKGGLELDTLFIIDTKRQPVWGKSISEDGENIQSSAMALETTLTQDLLFDRVLAGEPMSGLISVEQEHWVLAAHRVTHNSGEGTANGILVMGRRLSPTYVQQLSQRAKVNFRVVFPQKEDLLVATHQPIPNDVHGSLSQIVDDHNVRAYRETRDLLNRSSVGITLEVPRNVYQLGLKASIAGGLTLSLMGLFLAYLRIRLAHKADHLLVLKEQLSTSLVAKTEALRAYKQAESERSALDLRVHQKYKMEAIGTMAGGIAHDFNNILAIILGNANLIQHKLPEDNRCQKNLANLLTATTRATELVKQILTYSRQEKILLQPRKLISLLNESLDLIHATVPTTITILQNFDEEGNRLWINADATQFQQVLINLCTNAIHAMEDHGTLKFRLTQRTLEPGDLPIPYHQACGRFAQLSITDSGTGMNSELQAKIFNPFFTTKGPHEGTGMGLAVVQGIVESHSGMIHVESEEGRGSTFHLYFPLSDHADANQRETTPLIPRGEEHILFVDDEKMLVSTASEILRNLGYKVTAESSSTLALAQFRNNPTLFDLVITDKTMPELSGLQLADEIRRINKDIPIILCSGYHAGACHQDQTNEAITTFCSKPLDADQLALAIRQTLDSKDSSSSR